MRDAGQDVAGDRSEIVVEFPLRGEWIALNTPAERVPSHGTNYLGQRYAFDFIQVDPVSELPYRQGLVRHLLWVQPAEAFLCWDQDVRSVFDGRVTAVGEGWPDRTRVNVVLSVAGSALWAPRPRGSDIRPLAGNYVIVEGGSGSAFYAHLKHGSVRFEVGDTVGVGDLLGSVGNSGNTTMPHLHFHLMDRPDIHSAKGLPCSFRALERHIDGEWMMVPRVVPGRDERVRVPISTGG